MQTNGRSFTNQLGIYDDRHIEGLTAMAEIAHRHGALASVQLHHGGMSAAKIFIGSKLSRAPPTRGPRALERDLAEVEDLRDDLHRRSRRAERAGFDGIELHEHRVHPDGVPFARPHTAHGRYLRDPSGRSRLLREIQRGIRATCGPDFNIGLRLALSGQDAHLPELRDVVIAFLERYLVDYFDLVVRNLDVRVEVGPFARAAAVDLFTRSPESRVSVTGSGAC